MSTSTVDGMRGSCEGSIAKWMAAVPSGFDSMDDTLPTWTPRIFTLASGFITSPARSEITVTGTVSVKLPRNRLTASATTAAIAITVPRPARTRTVFGFIGPPSPGQVEVAVGTVNGQRDQQGHRDDHDQRGAHRVTYRDTDTRRAAGGEEAEVGVDQQDRDRHQDRLKKRPQQVDRVQEGVEA